MKKVKMQMRRILSLVLIIIMVVSSTGFQSVRTLAEGVDGSMETTDFIQQISAAADEGTENAGEAPDKKIETVQEEPVQEEPDQAETVSKETVSGGTIPEGTTSEETTSEETASEETVPEETKPEEPDTAAEGADAEEQDASGEKETADAGMDETVIAADEEVDETMAMMDASAEEETETEDAAEPAVIDDSSTKGSIMFQIHWNDEINTASDTPRYFDWSEITRPAAVPNDPNGLVQLYRYKKTESGNVDESTIEQLTLQNGNHGGENFCRITITEGEPYWSVSVGNVPMPEGYHFFAAGPGQLYYSATAAAYEKETADEGSEELKLNYVEYELSYADLAISESVIPEDAEPSFTYNVKVSDTKLPYKGTYTINGEQKVTQDGTISGVHNGDQIVLLQIPTGMSYEITAAEANGYMVIYDEDTESGTVAVKHLSNNQKVTLKKVWNDNNDPDRSEAKFIAALQFEYKVGDGEWTAFSEGSAPFASVDFSIDKSGYNSWVVNAVHNGDRNFPAAVMKEDGSFDLIEYRITEGSIDGYISTTADDGTVTNTKSMDFSAGIEWKDDSDVDNRPETVNLKLNAYYVDADIKHEIDGEAFVSMGIESSVVSVEAGKDDTTSVEISSLPMYTSEGYPLIYYLEQETPEGYSSTYDNQGTNYALNETACFSGGKIINLRRDYTTFSATKKWIDAGNNDTSKRPKAMVYLYRYVDGQTEANATPVTILDKNGKSVIVCKEIPAADINGTSTISFEDVLQNIDEEGHQLFKYDGEGREYIYLVKEILIPRYSDGGEQTNLEYYKTYYDKDGNVVSSLLEGGKVVNRRMPMADVQVQKSWVAASFPGAANGTEVTMKVKVSEDDGTNWTYLQDNEGNDLEITVSGFSQDQLTVGQTMTLPMYNEDGKALQYQAEEISVTKNGTEVFDQTTGQTVIDGHTFQCTAAPLIMSSVTEPANSNQNAKAELTCSNTLADQADLTIIKNWSGITPEDTYVVNVQVKRYLYTGAEDTDFVPVSVAVSKGTEGFKTTISDLPLYDAEGYPYEYRTTELSVTNNGEEVTKTWSTICDYHYDYNKKEITSTITNYKGGEGTYRSVRKTWLDDGCVEGRLPVTAQVYDSEGNPWEGKSIELSQANGWEGRIYFSEEDMLDERYLAGVVIKESKVGTYDVDYKGETEGYTDQKSDDGMTGVVRTDETNGFIFIVTNTNNEDGSAEIVNRRVGKIQIHIEKEWIDGNRENASRPALSVDVYRNDQKFAAITLGSDDQADAEDNQNKWVKLSDSFDKYDENGKQYTYTVQEVVSQDLRTDDYLTESEVGTYDTTASRYHSGDIQNFSITNKREGETAFTVNKIWHDTEGTATHPDIRVELYYQAKDADSDALTYYKYGEGPYSELMQDPIDYVWSEAGAGAAYDVSCTVNRLPKYAEDGSQITYFCKEIMPIPGDYKTFYWNASGCQAKSGANEAGYAANGEFIENRPEAKIDINGTKLWLNLQAGTKAEDIDSSGIHITLYHYVGTKPADFETDPSKYKVKSVTLEEASAANKNRAFLFSNVDKYDALGRKYTFEMRETIDGKLGYVYSNDPSGFRITNTFLTGSANNRKIQVIKDWDSGKYTDNIKAGQEFEYPDTVFKLYRSAGKSEDDNEIDLNGDPIATITLSAARGQSSGTMEFPAQLIWSEYGVQYKYAVVEVVDGVPSYQIPAKEQTVYISDKDRNGNDVEYTPDNKPGFRTAYFKNTYEPKTGYSDLRLSGAKYWKDANGAHRPDPADLVLNVYRSAPGTALSTAMPEVQLRYGTDYTIRWQTTTYKNCWYYTITGAAITEFAPNGQRFVYRITEEVPEGYEVSGGASQNGEVNNAKLQRMTDMTNTLTGTYTVSKRWDDNNNEYALRPVSVIVVLQRSNDNGANWEYVTTTNNTDDKLYDVPGETGVKALSVELNVGNKWKYTFENLDPTYIYRAEEVAAGSKDGTGDKTLYPYWRNTSEGDRHMIGSYNISYDYSDTQTTVTNKLDPTTLSVTKIWAGDNNNYYDSRPLNDAGVPTVTVKIQRKYWNEDDGEDDANWKDVLNTNGKPVTMVLSSTDKSHTWEYGNLPKCDYIGRNYEYRAVEITDHVQGYEAAHESRNLNQIFIQNTLIERERSISVEKKWREGDVTSHPPVVIELTRWVPSGTDPSIKVPYPKSMTITLDGTPDDMTNTPAGESSAWVATWNHLPKCDNDGNDYIYKVEEISISGTPVENKKAAGYLVDNGEENDEQIVWDSDSKVEIRNTLAMEYKVSKEFKNDTYADRPTSVTVQLQRTTATTIDESTSWENVGKETKIEGFTNEVGKTEVSTVSHTFTNLPKYDKDNNLYTYRAVETKIGTNAVTNNFASGYDVTYEDADTDETHYGCTITNTMRTIDITGKKEWDDQSNYYQMRPASVSVKLYNGTTQVAKQPVPTWTKPEGNTWTFLFSGLPMYDAKGNRITYTAKEVGAITGYTVSNNELTGDFSAATNGATITVAKDENGIINTLDVVTITGSKTWAGDTDDDINGTRVDIQPDSIEVKLMNGDNEVTVPAASYTAASSANNWEYTFVNVPKYDSTGAQINYTVVETAVPGYTESRDETNDKLITNTLDTVDLTATKVWDDQNNKYSTRPADWNKTDGTGLFTVYADYGDGAGFIKMTTQPTCTWTGSEGTDGKGTYTFTVANLQKYNLVSGAAVEVQYKVQEDATPAAYTQSETTAADGTKTITNTLDVSSINVTKTWADNSNFYGTRPSDLTLNLQWKKTLTTGEETDWADVDPALAYTWTKADGSNVWTCKFADLPNKDVNGNAYSYRIKETVPTGYYSDKVNDTVDAAIADGTGSVAFTNTLYTVNVTGTKTWDDQDNHYQIRPASVSVKLYNGTTQVAKQPVPTWTKPEGNTWTFLFSGLPMYDAKGNRITYTAKEVGAITGYTVSNNELTGDFSAATNGATITVAKDGKGIINTLDVVDVTGTKTWAGESANGTYTTIKPDSIEVKLMNGNTEVNVPATSYTAAVAEPAEGIDAWTYKFTNVPKYDKDGKLITYKVVETKVPGYTESRDKTNDNLITNTLDKTTLTATKVWDDQNNKYSTRPADWNKTDGTGLFTVYADYGDGAGFIEMTTQPTCTWTGSEGTDGKGTYTFTAANLQKYNLVSGAAVEVQYKVQEDAAPAAYTQSETTAADGTKTITNTLDVSSIAVTKNWSDNSNNYGTRPDNLAITLQWKTAEDADWSNVTNTSTATGNWTKNGNTWTYTYTNLPKKDVNGNEYSYRVVETVPHGYTAAADTIAVDTSTGAGTAEFTNTLDASSIAVTKNWSDNSNNYGTRPDNLAITLQWKTAEDADWSNVTNAPTAAENWTKNGNTWTYTYTNLPKKDVNGNEYSYRVVETVPHGYTAAADTIAVDTSTGAGTAEFTNTLDVSSIAVTKNWSDNSNNYGTRPDNLALTLQWKTTGEWSNATNAPVLAAGSWTKNGNTWTYTYTNLPKKDVNGNDYSYRVVETVPHGYTAAADTIAVDTSTGAGTVEFTNTLDVSSIAVTKNWSDNSNNYGTRPDNLALTLQWKTAEDADWSNVTNAPALEEGNWTKNGNTWTYTYTNLPKKDVNGNDYSYRVVETVPHGYTAAADTIAVDTSTGAGTAEFTNTLDVSSINVTKTWVDNSDAYGTRPDNLALTLQWKTAEDADWSNVTNAPALAEGNWTKNGDTWTYTYTGLPNEDVNGNAYSYRVVETVPAGYHTAVNADIAEAAISEGTGSVSFTNTFDHGYVQINKVFADTGDNGTLAKPLATFKIENEAKTRSFIVKTDAAGKFVIDSTDGSYTGTDGNKFCLIPGNYTLTEQSAEALADGCRFTVDTNSHEFTVVNDQTVVVSNETGDSGVFRNMPVRGALTLTKMDEKYIVVDGQLEEKTDKGELLGGAEFNICLDEAGTQVVTALIPVENSAGVYTLPTDAASDLTNAIGVPYLTNGKLLCGTYYIIETSEPEGYYIKDSQSPKQITIGADTNAAIVDVTPEMENTLIEQPFKIAKDYEIPNAAAFDAEGKKIGEEGSYTAADAADYSFTFTVERTDDSTPAFEYTDTKTTNADGIADFGNIPYGTYTVTETAVADYIENSAFTITVNENGVTLGSETAVLTDGTTKVHNTLKRGSISGTVIDKEYNDILLKGAEVGLYNEDGVLVAKVTTDANGAYSFENIPYGNYKVAEVKSPKNYVLNNTPIDTSIENDEDKIVLSPIENEPVRISVTLHKIDNETGEAMKDVAFALTGTDFRGYDVEMTAQTAEDGTLTFEKITVGNAAYVLTETKVDDYEAPHSFTYTVTNQENGNSNIAVGELVDTSAGGDTASLAEANGDGSYTITNIRIRRDFSFTKTGTDDENDLTHASPLAGAQFGMFEIEQDAENYTGADGQTGPVKTAVSDADGTVTFTDIPSGGTWYVKEISAPANYTAYDAVCGDIAVWEDGRVTSSLETVVNEAIRGKIEFTKVDKDHHNITIPGAVYTLYKKDADSGEYDIEVTTATADDDGKVVFDNLLIGTDYRVEETQTVTNYLLAENTADFVLKLENGKAVTKLKLAENTPVETTDNGMLWNEDPVIHQFKIKKDYEIPNASAFDAEGKKIGEEGSYTAADAADHSFTFTVERTDDSTPAFEYTDTKPTNADGIADFGTLPYGTYTVTETAVADYIENSAFTITVSENGVTLGSETAVLTDGTTKVHNTLKRGSISGTVIDKEYNDILLKGAEVGLYNEDGVLVAKVTTDENGAYTFKDIPYGMYSVAEVKSPENYVLNDTLIKDIKQEGADIKLDPIENEPVKIAVSLHKIDNETKEILTDVEFILTGTDFRGKAVEQTLKTDKDGNLTFRDITVGKEAYTITETKVKDYEVPHSLKLSVTNQTDGNSNKAVAELVDSKAQTDETAENTVIKSETAEEEYTIVNIRIRRDFSFRKVGTDDELDLTKNTPLAGAEFGLYDNGEANGVPIQTAESDKNGNVTFTELSCGEWFLKELKAPENFMPDQKIHKVTVHEDGSVDSDLEIAVNEAVRGSIMLISVDMNDQTDKLQGTKYVLYKKDPETGEYKELMILETDENGEVEFKNLFMGTEYLVQKIFFAEGNQISKTTINVNLELNEAGEVITNLISSGDEAVEVDANGNVVWKQPPTVVDFYKFDQQNNMLSGAEFALTDENGNQVVDQNGEPVKWISSKEGAYRVEGVLTAGATYTLIEIKAPDGYKKTDPVTFKVEAVKSGINDIHVQEIKVINEKLPPEEKKNDTEKTDGEKADGEKADGEKADGEKADGEKADGEKTDGEKADGVNTGDDTPMMLLEMLTAGSLIVMAYLAGEERKRRRMKDKNRNNHIG